MKCGNVNLGTEGTAGEGSVWAPSLNQLEARLVGYSNGAFISILRWILTHEISQTIKVLENFEKHSTKLISPSFNTFLSYF